jgi:hypothetical protein
VAGEAGDILDGDAGVGHEADEGVPELAGRPGTGYAGGLDGGAELAADVGGVELPPPYYAAKAQPIAGRGRVGTLRGAAMR